MNNQGWGIVTGGNSKTYTIVGDGTTTVFNISTPFDNTNTLVTVWQNFGNKAVVQVDTQKPSTDVLRVIFSNFSIPQVGENYLVVIKKV